MNLQAFIGSSVERISVHYPVQEAKAIAVRLLKELLQGYKGYEHLVEPGTELDSFSLAEAGDSGAENFLLRCVERLAAGSLCSMFWVMRPQVQCGSRSPYSPS